MGAGREGGLAVTRRTETPSRPPLIDGSTSRFLLLLAVIAAVTGLALHGNVDGQAVIGLLAGIVGGLLHASGTKQGSEASIDPPPEA
jgi:Ni,Fe-hydrogenase I cytochrome b subunit